MVQAEYLMKKNMLEANIWEKEEEKNLAEFVSSIKNRKTDSQKPMVGMEDEDTLEEQAEDIPTYPM